MKRFILLAAFILTIGTTAHAREVITIQKANGGGYNITAYDNLTRSYYYLNGSIESDSHRVTVPDGYSCSVTVNLGRAVGTRNLYEKRDPLNPIYEVQKQSTYVLELVFKGRGSSGPSANSASPLDLFGGPSDGGQRQPPPGQ